MTAPIFDRPFEPGTVDFDEAAQWARLEKARAEAYARAQRGEPGFPGLYIRTALVMPEKLRVALGLPAPKKKRGARPLSSPKKRRSGSTQHTP